MAEGFGGFGGNGTTEATAPPTEVDENVDGDRRQFVDEFSRVVAAAGAIDNYEPMSQLVQEWRSTAEVHADPKLARRLGRPLTAAGTVVAAPAS